MHLALWGLLRNAVQSVGMSILQRRSSLAVISRRKMVCILIVRNACKSIIKSIIVVPRYNLGLVIVIMVPSTVNENDLTIIFIVVVPSIVNKDDLMILPIFHANR